MGRMNHVLILILISPIFLISCNEKVFTIDVNCDQCYSPKPDSIDLVIHWTKNTDFPEIQALLYKGYIDSGELIDTFYLFGNPARIYVKAEENYSVKALYESGDRKVYVIDGTKQKLKRVGEGICDDYECWVIENDELDVKLRY